MGLLATIKTRGAATVIGEYDPDGRCENLVRAEHVVEAITYSPSKLLRQQYC